MSLSTVILLLLLPVAFFLGKGMERKNNAARRKASLDFAKFLVNWLKSDGHRMYMPIVERIERHLDSTYGREWRKS